MSVMLTPERSLTPSLGDRSNSCPLTDAYFRFDPAGSGTLSIKCTAINIDGVLNVINTGNIVDLAVTDGKINTLTVSKLTTGTLDAQTITLANAGAIKLGKTSYADNTAGFWLGEGGVNALFNIGDASSYFKWTGSGILISGSITGTLSADLDMNSHAFSNCGKFMAGATDTGNDKIDISTANRKWFGQTGASTYLHLADTGSLRWSATGTVYAATELYMQSAGDVVLKPGGALDFDIVYATGKTGANVYVPCKLAGVSGYYFRLYT